MKLKIFTKRKQESNLIEDASILQRTINKLRDFALIPKGVYHFSSHKEADQWMIKQMALTRVHRNSKT